MPPWELHGLLDGKALAPERWGWVRQEVGDGNPLRAVLYLIGNSIFFFFFFFLGLHLRHMEVPGLGVESELQLPGHSHSHARSELHTAHSSTGSLTH